MAPRPVSFRYFNVFESTGKSVEVAPNSGDMFDIVARSAMLRLLKPGSEKLHELADDAVCS